MKIVVFGGISPIGSVLVDRLRQLNHKVIAGASLSANVAITPAASVKTLSDTDIVVDMTGTLLINHGFKLHHVKENQYRLLAAERSAGVRHHVALFFAAPGYLKDICCARSNVMLANAIRMSGVPFSIIHSTPFYESAGELSNLLAADGKVPVPPFFAQPIAADDVVSIITGVTLGAPLNDSIEIGGPEKIRLADFISMFLKATGDTRNVVTGVESKYLKSYRDLYSHLPGINARLGTIRFADWLVMSAFDKRVAMNLPNLQS
jgi:uncharacterized protein YbjT (DUF2867 family)